MNIKIVVGANFGDEGKGMMTNYFCKNSLNPIVIKHNGGAQAGHTVVENNIRHVFHHFGSGSLINVPTYLSKDFILNPTLFKAEYNELLDKGVTPECSVSSHCLITTPYDVLINQALEMNRGNERHGSCGCGIFETVTRNKFFRLEYIDLVKKLQRGEDVSSFLKDYAYKRLNELGVLSEDVISMVENENIYNNFLLDLMFMYENTKMNELFFLNKYNTLIFESAQGLLLDQYNMDYFPNLTPSSTGCENPSNYLKEFNNIESIEICYVSRSYMTRHGAGRLDYECTKEDINKGMVDLTNVPNPYQGTLRYGKINNNDLMNRINKDSLFIKNLYANAEVSIAVTHLNETDNKIVSFDDIPLDIKYKSFEENSIVCN